MAAQVERVKGCKRSWGRCDVWRVTCDVIRMRHNCRTCSGVQRSVFIVHGCGIVEDCKNSIGRSVAALEVRPRTVIRLGRVRGVQEEGAVGEGGSAHVV